MNAVEMRNVRYRWRRSDPFELAVGDFTIGEGEKLLLLGPSGSGKSTLLSLLSGVLVPDCGTVRVLGADLRQLGGAARDRFRADHLGILFQMFNLVPYLSCLDNILLPLQFSAARRRRAAERGTPAQEALRLLARLGIEPERFAHRTAAELSVGQQQRVGAARALIGRPGLIIADEPTSALDREAQGAFLALLAEECAAAGAALLMVSHDPSLAARFDRAVQLAELGPRAPETAEAA